jgi:hypothetical protein
MSMISAALADVSRRQQVDPGSSSTLVRTPEAVADVMGKTKRCRWFPAGVAFPPGGAGTEG